MNTQTPTPKPLSAVGRFLRNRRHHSARPEVAPCLLAVFLLLAPAGSRAATGATTNPPAWITRPLALADCLNLALQQNGTLLQARSDLQASHGVVIQTRAIVIPKVQATGSVTDNDPTAVDRFPFGGSNVPPAFHFQQPHEQWNSGFQLVQSIYEGGRITSALRTAKLTKDQALLNYQTAVADTLVNTRVAYYDVLMATQQIVVHEASVNLLNSQLEDQQRRFDAGTVPRFNVLRAEVAVANERPALIRARNEYRIAKNNLSVLLGYNLPREIWEDIPLRLSDPLTAEPYQVELPAAIAQALNRRTELGALRKAEQLQRENVVAAKAGNKPSVQAFAGYSWFNSQFTDDLSHDLNGWNFGARLNWSIFDGMLTRGKVMQAEALQDKSKVALDDTSRRIELEVRTAYSTFIEAKEVLESQEKVQEEAEEALRLANARAEAGTSTQLDVLDAQTSLTQARTTRVQALHDYAVARARLERAIGLDLAPAADKP